MATGGGWRGVESFDYHEMSVDLSTGEVRLGYELRGRQPLRFTETLTFPLPDRPPDAATRDTFRRVLELLHIAAGTSYYKVAAPKTITLPELADHAMPWARALFQQGMGEYAYRNDLPHVLDVELTRAGDGQPDYDLRNDDRRSDDRLAGGRAPLVPVGGGKDSIVSVEALRAAGHRPVLFAVNPNPIIDAVVRVSGCPALTVRRRLDPNLLALNTQGAYNGHVPVTAINSLAAVAAAVLHSCGPVVMSNERSASAPNLTWQGREVNHQWSKGVEAERLLREALATHAGLTNTYFSLLRGLSELHIAKLYAAIDRADDYDPVMTSCNAAFRLSNPTDRWCGDCPKCRFVFLALAAFLGRHRLTAIFAVDLLADPAQVPGYRELCGLAAAKPFECVGEPEECLVALRLAAEHPDWANAPVVGMLRAQVPPRQWPTDADVARVLGDDRHGYAPPEYIRALAALPT